MQLTALVLAVTAAAFVIIPELSEADENIFKALPINTGPLSLPIPAESHRVAVPCKQCEGKNSNLQLNFDVVDYTRLLLNGFEVYPHADPWHGDLAADVESTDREATKEKLGYSLAISPEAMDKDSHIQVLDVELRVIEVGNRFVDSVPVVNVKLINVPSGELAIAVVETTSTKISGCHSMACQAKEVMADALKAIKGFRPFKGCHRRPHHGKDKAHHKSNPNRPHSENAHDGLRKHPHPHHHFGDNHRHEWGRLITNLAAQIFLPVLLGLPWVCAAYSSDLQPLFAAAVTIVLACAPIAEAGHYRQDTRRQLRQRKLA
ncbi:hypothetical protein VFPPC_04701 [Pochonia chlamydosporia 170]|uniref:DUF7728 domain-containing protein n=1 Tax=Pochonia chlamydosporia 170 TaxID=1380566 RepID=A0A179FT84_METCM|nr:hypothetical protein VFPPC_04701 [Pochonia chlamydosporia 170]OAQ68468.2 hypothetical protein VFPPC_04701 [Pochonia chlamydosporia 170]